MIDDHNQSEHPDPSSIPQSRSSITRAIRDLALIILALLLLTFFRAVESTISILLLCIGVAVAVAIVFLVQSGGTSVISWCVIVIGLPIEILLFKNQVDSEESTYQFIDSLKERLHSEIAKHKR